MKLRILALAACVAAVPAAALAQSQAPVRVGGNIQAPERTKYVAPVYPAIAATANVQGVVIAEAVVGTDGTVGSVQILKSIPLLDQAAIDAVKQWQYTPTTLNGVPVPVIMTVTVNFSLSGASGSAAPVPSPMPMQTTMTVDPAGALPTMWNGQQTVRIGGEIKAPERVKYVQPAYPPDAQAAGVGGIVIIEAIVDNSGDVAMTKVLKSIPLLDQAALDAVSQWKYTPTLMNGIAVPVVMTVTVNFSIR